ncbi:DUF255 domain-containing protein [Neorhodopirellula pilleata]|uniref:Thioredoxin domain-containing protein n=1 Tax=Neorhodopirellula pilleata TaxID=2714738 RepID=A0A5C6A935_9BACT|nr:DUF255 domain-containing protein [Neorhodopirellula pilleata]TWT95551.1 hypothetical protein Pla100_31920 [Neorhodopirellula pilleata]
MRLAWPRRIQPTVLSGLILAGSFAFLASPGEAQIPWRSDLTSAHAEAKAQNKPLLLHFYSDNCIWCDRLEAGAFRSGEVGEAIANGFVPIKIHAGKSPELAKMFKVTKFPTDVVVTPAGQTLAHGVSPQEPSRYVAMLAQAGSEMPSMPANTIPGGPASGTQMPGTQMPGTPMPGSPMPGSPMAPATERLAAASHTTMPKQTSGAAINPNPGQPVPNPYGQSGFALPAGVSTGETLPGGASTRLAGARTDGMSLGMPEQIMDEPAMEATQQIATDAAISAKTPPSESSINQNKTTTSPPKLAMEGFCAVTVIDEDKWVEGNPKFGVVHLGKLYLFASAEKMDSFLADPTPYTPVLNEIDVVRFFEERQIVQGKRRFGMRDPIHQRMFFFADEAAMNHFFNEYERYTDAAIEVMAQAVNDANPGIR